MKLLVSLATGLAIGLLIGRWHWKQPLYTEVRGGFVRLLVEQGEPVDTLILGDSIGESTWLDGVCGRTFNASVGGSYIANVRDVAALAIPRLKPRIIVIEAGTNDLRGGASLETFQTRYSAFVRGLPPARLILVGTPANEPASAFIRQLAVSRGAAYVPPAMGGDTSDGIHPNLRGGRLYRSRIAVACQTVRS